MFQKKRKNLADRLSRVTLSGSQKPPHHKKQTKKKPYKTPKTKTRRVRGLKTEMERRVRNLPLQLFVKAQKFHQSGRKPFQAVKKLPFLGSPSPTTTTSSRSSRWQAVEAPFLKHNSRNPLNYSLYYLLMQTLRLKLCYTNLIQQ